MSNRIFTLFFGRGSASAVFSGCVVTSAVVSLDLELVVLFFAAGSEVVRAGEEAGLRKKTLGVEPR